MSQRKISVGILGATGTVGQRFIQLLAEHPYFIIGALGASERSAGISLNDKAGKPYAEVTAWKQSTPIPDHVAKMVVFECKSEFFVGKVDLVFSGLDSSVAGPCEEDFASHDFPVFSNAKNHRMDPDVPLLIPTCNPDHIDMGFIVCNTNCATTGLAVALQPIAKKFGIKKAHVTTMQAVSGAGYPGVPTLDIFDNVVPYIGDEENKLESEPRKVLGAFADGKYVDYEMRLSAQCNRVMVLDGHTECVSIKLHNKATPEQVIEAISSWSVPALSALPSCPPHAVVVIPGNDRPQPRLDRNIGNGYTVSVGRVRECPLYDIKLVLLSHNTIIGAAGGSILNAELAIAKGYIH